MVNVKQAVTNTCYLNKWLLNNDLCLSCKKSGSPLSFECASHNAVDRIRPLLYKSHWLDN